MKKGSRQASAPIPDSEYLLDLFPLRESEQVGQVTPQTASISRLRQNAKDIDKLVPLFSKGVLSQLNPLFLLFITSMHLLPPVPVPSPPMNLISRAIILSTMGAKEYLQSGS